MSFGHSLLSWTTYGSHGRIFQKGPAFGYQINTRVHLRDEQSMEMDECRRLVHCHVTYSPLAKD